MIKYESEGGRVVHLAVREGNVNPITQWNQRMKPEGEAGGDFETLMMLIDGESRGSHLRLRRGPGTAQHPWMLGGEVQFRGTGQNLTSNHDSNIWSGSHFKANYS